MNHFIDSAIKNYYKITTGYSMYFQIFYVMMMRIEFISF
jgi:hypothetical protein